MAYILQFNVKINLKNNPILRDWSKPSVFLSNMVYLYSWQGSTKGAERLLRKLDFIHKPDLPSGEALRATLSFRGSSPKKLGHYLVSGSPLGLSQPLCWHSQSAETMGRGSLRPRRYLGYGRSDP